MKLHIHKIALVIYVPWEKPKSFQLKKIRLLTLHKIWFVCLSGSSC
uniref:Uncharacterized protein n=1 Tax=Anguilla anguilla TaxID=7936 RepID=A0A0E9Q5W4_ANGAN